MKNTTDPASGGKIPSTVNGTVTSSQNKDCPKDIAPQQHAGIQGLKSYQQYIGFMYVIVFNYIV
jgi:hypothetical protein